MNALLIVRLLIRPRGGASGTRELVVPFLVGIGNLAWGGVLAVAEERSVSGGPHCTFTRQYISPSGAFTCILTPAVYLLRMECTALALCPQMLTLRGGSALERARSTARHPRRLAAGRRH